MPKERTRAIVTYISQSVLIILPRNIQTQCIGETSSPNIYSGEEEGLYLMKDATLTDIFEKIR